MTAATWVMAAAALVTAVGNGLTWLRHERADRDRFAEHAGRLAAIENGAEHRHG
jgi:hypothetical protein